MGEYNLVLLPDTLMKLKQGDLYEEVMKSLFETGFVFLYKKEKNAEMLKTKGALYINEDGNCMELSTLEQEELENEITQTPMFGSKGIEVSDYSDLGTWPEIRKLFLNYEKDNK